MSPAVPRLKRRSEFLRVAGARRKWVAPGLIVQVRERPPAAAGEAGEAPIRVGFTASRKVGNAVARNRVRRRLRAVAETVLPRHARAGRDYVIIGRAATLRRPYDALVADMCAALKRLDAWRGAGEASEAAASGRTKAR